MAVCKVLLINEQEVKNLTSITGNVDVKKFCPFIPVAQDMYVKSAIGESCYSDLLDGVENDNLTADEIILLEGNSRTYMGIKIALAWWVLYKSYPSLRATINPTTVAIKTGDDFVAVDNEGLGSLRNEAKVNAEYYTDQIVCFICDNSELYPCYDDCDDCNERVHSGYGTSGIVTDGKRSKLFDIPLDDNDLLNLLHRKGH